MLPPELHATLRELDVTVPSCRRVLLVDDEPGNLDVLGALLEEDWEVSTAESGDEALELLRRHGPVDLIIADQRMPGMTGVELLAQVARRHPSTVRIVLTGYTDVEPMLAAANQGLVYRFLLKPFDPMEMQAVVADAMQIKATVTALLELVTTLDQRCHELEDGTVALREAREQLLAEERLNTLGRLVSEMANDLHTQSASLSLLLGLVRQTVRKRAVLGAAETAWAGLSGLRELLSQVRDYSRAATVEPKFQSVDPRQLLAQTMELFLMEDLGHLCPVLAHCDPAILRVQVDATRIQQALLALLRNAVRASAVGEAIHMGLELDGEGQLIIQVQDQGTGMDEQSKRRALEPFYSGFPTPGIGLGLEIARLSAQTHGGVLSLESDLETGTKARIALPASVVEVGHAS
jgi:signal transduction histidine kinase